jgi:hypothetical protein
MEKIILAYFGISNGNEQVLSTNEDYAVFLLKPFAARRTRG